MAYTWGEWKGNLWGVNAGEGAGHVGKGRRGSRPVRGR